MARKGVFEVPIDYNIVETMIAEGYTRKKIAEFFGASDNTLLYRSRIDPLYKEAEARGKKRKAAKETWYWSHLRELRERKRRPVTFWVTAGEEDVLNITLRELRQSVSDAEKGE